MTPQSEGRWSTAMWAVCAFSIAIWWAMLPYLGLQHDALYYAADALRRLQPQSLSRDVFFGAATQGDRSIFGAPYAALIQLAGVDLAAFLSTFAAKLTWLVAFWLLCRTLLSAARAPWLFALTLVLPGAYDGMRVLRYAEMFATPRPWAEAAVMAALALALCGRMALAAMMVGLAMAFHPLMGLAGAGVLFFLLPSGWRWCVGGLGALVLAGAVALDLGPASALMQRYDDAWWTTVTTRNAMVLMSVWSASAHARSLIWVTLLVVAMRASPQDMRGRMARALAWTLVATMVASALGEWTRNVLLIQLQLWRSLWLAQLLAPLLWLHTLPPVRQWRWPQALHVTLVASAVLLDLWSSPVLVGLAFGLLRPGVQAWLEARPGWKRGVHAAVGLVVLAAVAVQIPDLEIYRGFFALADSDYPWLHAALCQTWATLVLLGGLVVLVVRGPRPWAAAASRLAWATCVFSLLGYTAVAWQRAHALRDDLSEVDRALPANAVVYGDLSVDTAWLRLRRAYYASDRQGSGNLFSRNSALELWRREERLAGLGLESFPGLPKNPAARTLSPTEKVAALCSDPVLDWVILYGEHPGANRLVHVYPEIPERRPRSMYECTQWRGR